MYGTQRKLRRLEDCSVVVTAEGLVGQYRTKYAWKLGYLVEALFERMRTCVMYVYQANGAATLTSHTSKGITLHSQFLHVLIEFYREKSFRCGINLVEHPYLRWFTCVEVRQIKFFCPVMAHQRHRGTHIFTNVHMNSPSLHRFPGMCWKVTQSDISILKKSAGFCTGKHHYEKLEMACHIQAVL